ncbi:ELMO domain-containing protein 3, variant 4 [Chamberlinius hualienensis]
MKYLEMSEEEITREHKIEVEVVNKLSEAEGEWEAVPDVIPSIDGIYHGKGNEQGNVYDDRCILFNEAWENFQSKDMDEYFQKTCPTLEMSKTAMVFRFLWGPPTLNPILVDERNLIFAIAACPLQTAEEFQMRVLQTIYKKLCNSKFSAPRYGSHWEDIGFQGSDPATDLRGVGVWGLMNLLYMLMCPEAFPLALSIYRLSQHEIQHFPFAIMSLNISAIVLKVLREERLNKICNRRKQVAIVVNDLYVAAFRYLFTRWKNDRKTVFDSGYILRGII